jgi:hypothetical protein
MILKLRPILATLEMVVAWCWKSVDSQVGPGKRIAVGWGHQGSTSMQHYDEAVAIAVSLGGAAAGPISVGVGAGDYAEAVEPAAGVDEAAVAEKLVGDELEASASVRRPEAPPQCWHYR